jgi:hypothetical protein
MLLASFYVLAGGAVVVSAAWLSRRLPVPAPLAWAGIGLLGGPAGLALAGPGSGRVLVEGAALLVFFEMGLRLTDRQGRRVRATTRRLLSASGPCVAGVFLVMMITSTLALGATLTQSLFAGLVLAPTGVLFRPGAASQRSAVLLGTGATGLCGLVALPLLADAGAATRPGWVLALRYVFICIAFVSIALVLRHRLGSRRLLASGGDGRSLAGGGAAALALAGASAWIGPGLGFSCFVAGLALSRSRWKGRALFARLSGIRTGAALLLFTGLGILAGSLVRFDLVLVAAGVAAGVFALRAGTPVLFEHVRQQVAVRAVLRRGLPSVPLGAVAFAVLYAGLDARAGLPATWAAAAPPVLAGAALVLAVGRVVAGHRLGAHDVGREPPPSEDVLDVESIPPGAPREAVRRALCHGPFFARRRPTRRAPHLHLVRVARDAPATSLSLRRLALRRHYGAEIVGLWRHDAFVHAPPTDYTLRAGDHVLLSAAPARFSQSARLFRSSSDFH